MANIDASKRKNLKKHTWLNTKPTKSRNQLMFLNSGHKHYHVYRVQAIPCRWHTRAEVLLARQLGVVVRVVWSVGLAHWPHGFKIGRTPPPNPPHLSETYTLHKSL